MGLKGPIFVPFWSPKKIKILDFGHFHSFHISIVSHAHCKYLYMCGENWHQRSNILANLGPQMIKKNWSLVIFQIFLTGLASVLVSMSVLVIFKGVLNIGLRGPISGSFGAPK